MFAYGSAGQVTQTSADGGQTVMFFDSLSRYAKVIDPVQHVMYFNYDAASNLIQSTDSTGAIYSYAYDSRNRLTQTTNPLGATNSYSYLGQTNKIAAATDSSGNSIRFTYDSAGRQLTSQYLDGSIESYAYDPAGSIQRSTSRGGQAISYAHDTSGRVTHIVFEDGTTADYTYDGRGNLTVATDATGTITLTYNNFDQIANIAYPGGFTLDFTYDSAGRRTTMVDQTGFTVKYQYDSRGRLSSLADGSGTAIVAYAYNVMGRLTRKDFANGASSIYTYDLVGQVSSIVNHGSGGSVLSRFDYAYDLLGNRTGEGTSDGNWTYQYDGIGRLTHAIFQSTNPSLPDQDLSYGYDSAGNLLQTTSNGTSTTVVHNGLDQYESFGDADLRYDTNGNLVSKHDSSGTSTFSYDASNRLLSAALADGSTQTYQYDAFGNLNSITRDGQKTSYVVDPAGLGNIVGEYDGAGSLVTHYTVGQDLTSRVAANGSAAYYHFDAVGSTAGLTDSAGQSANKYAYLPFGNLLASSQSVANPFTFVGGWGVMSMGSGLSYMRNRIYDANLARFNSSDSLGIWSGDINPYTYAGNNPVNSSDPSGLIRKIQIIIGATAIVGALSGPVLIATGVIASGAAITFTLVGGAVSLAAGMEQVVTGFNDKDPILPGGPAGLITRLIPDAGPKHPKLQAILDGVRVIADGADIITGLRIDGVTKGASTLAGRIWNNSSLLSAEGFVLNNLLTFINKHPDLFVELVNSIINIPPAQLAASLAGILQTAGVNSKDPNDLVGPAGFGPEGFLAPSEQPFAYRINFENDKTATAPAQRVTISNQLASHLDWNTLAFTEVGFGDTIISIPAGTQYFQTTLELTQNDKSFDVEIELRLDSATGLVFATFQSLDPNTELPPDVLTGFLPPENGTGRGMGHIGYIIEPRKNLATGTQIRNVALIRFDSNELIATDQVDPHDASKGIDPAKQALITIDAGGPTSAVTSLPSTSPLTFTVNWSGSDDSGGSGIASYDIYVSDNGGAFTPWLIGTPLTSSSFTGLSGHTYRFYSVATDNVGNRQPTPAAAQATTQALGDIVAPTSTVAALPATSPTSFTVSWSGSDNAGGSGLGSYDIFVSDNGAAYTSLLAAATQTSTTFNGTNGHTYRFYSVAVDNAGNRQATPASAQATTLVSSDTVAPTSSITALLKFSAPAIKLSWSGTDNAGGSGVARYDIFVSDNGSAFTAFLTGTTATSTTYSGISGHSYGFFSVAIDQAGNRQATPSAAQASTQALLDTPNKRYVESVYLDVLGREPDAGGLQFWSGQLDQGGARATLINLIDHSAEYFSTIINPAYQTFLGRQPDAIGLAYWVDAMTNGLTDEQLEAGFIGSPEYYQYAGGTDMAWVDAMYQNLLGRGPDDFGRNFWVEQLANGASRSGVAYGFAASAEREGQHVQAAYEKYLGRKAGQSEIDYWVDQFVNHGKTNEDVITGFVSSDEYYQKHSN